MDFESQNCESTENVKIESNGDVHDFEESEDASDSSGSPGMLPPLYKEQGLRKWRRIRREYVKDETVSNESAKILKRGSEDLVNQKSSFTSSADTCSDEERDSKSSTSTSIPESKNEIPGPKVLSQDDVDDSKKPWDRADSDSGSEKLPSCPSASVGDEGILKSQAAPLSWKTREKDKNHQISGNWDPLADCILTLQSTQEALEQEIQKFSELGRDLRPFDEDPIRTTSRRSSIGPEFCIVSSTGSPTSDFGTEIPDVLISMTRNIEIFEKQIQETKGMIKEKETKIAQLQATVENLNSSNEDLQRSINLQQNLYEEIETEVEKLYTEKMEAEILYLVFADTSTVVENQMKLLLAEQKSFVSTRGQELQKVANLECRAAKLKDKTEGRLTTSDGGTTAKMQKAFYFFIQLVLLFCVYKIFRSQFLSKTIVVLPT